MNTLQEFGAIEASPGVVEVPLTALWNAEEFFNTCLETGVQTIHAVGNDGRRLQSWTRKTRGETSCYEELVEGNVFALAVKIVIGVALGTVILIGLAIAAMRYVE